MPAPADARRKLRRVINMIKFLRNVARDESHLIKPIGTPVTSTTSAKRRATARPAVLSPASNTSSIAGWADGTSRDEQQLDVIVHGVARFLPAKPGSRPAGSAIVPNRLPVVSSAAKFARPSIVAELIHVRPPFQPSTVGGSNSDWPSWAIKLTDSRRLTADSNVRCVPSTNSAGLLMIACRASAPKKIDEENNVRSTGRMA